MLDVVRMVITYGKSVGQPGKAAIPDRGQLNKENELSLPPFTPENLVSRDGFGRPFSTLRVNLGIWCLLTGFLPLSAAAASIYFLLIIPPIRHRVSPEFSRSHNCVPMAFPAESSPAQCQ